MKIQVAVLAMTVLCGGAPAAPKEDGVLLHYSFDKKESTARDISGSGNHGKILGGVKWTQDGGAGALQFDGLNGYIDCGKTIGAGLRKAGTLEVWCKPEAIQGGLISWHTGAGWQDQRLVLGFMNYALAYKDIMICIADGAGMQRIVEGENPGSWVHLVMTFDGTTVALYRNGDLVLEEPQEVDPLVQGIPLRIGLSDGLGDACFKGLMNEVSIYSRALSSQEIEEHFRAKAQAMALPIAQQPKLTTTLLAAKGELRVAADLRLAGELPVGARAKFALWNAVNKTWVTEKFADSANDVGVVTVTFDTKGLVAGLHEVRMSMLDGKGIPTGLESITRFHYPRRAQMAAGDPNVKILNNMVMELINRNDLPASPYQEIAFQVSQMGWVYVSSKSEIGAGGEVQISVDGEKEDAVLIQQSGGQAQAETMRFISDGPHKLRIWCANPQGTQKPVVRSLIVRSIPEIMYCGYPAGSLAGYGWYDFKFLEKDVLPNITTIIGALNDETAPQRDLWKKRGGHWLLEQNLPHLVKSDSVTPALAYDWWVNSEGFKLGDGVMADEFSEGDLPAFKGYTEAVRRIGSDKSLADKSLYLWVASESMQVVEALSKEFLATVFAGSPNLKIAHERYLSEQPSESLVAQHLQQKIGRQIRLWEANFPGSTERMIVVPGILCVPPESLDARPSVDFKVSIDKAFQYYATAPECCGLFGIMVYKSRYADEETVRWTGRLFRHYFIEGNTDLLSDRLGYKYELRHILNADFDSGLENWTVEAAGAGSVAAREMKGFGRMQGRMGGGIGNHVVWMKRSEQLPNRVSQQIKELVPGQLYCLKVIVADYQDWRVGKSERKEIAASVRIEGGELIPAKCFVFPNHGLVRLGPFAAPTSGVAWHNFHWLVFRAKAPTGELTLSDWKDDKAPGGPVGQELMFNFVELQPYFGE